MLVLSVILAILVIILGYFTWNLMRKVEKYEDVAQFQQNYIENLSNVIRESSKKIKEIDANGTFESDDEVGYFFGMLKEVQSILDEFNLNMTDGQKEEQG